ncbi:hypothetical protein [Parasedimentitalea huanghaiensis]|uniref:hypothetical protein n=1 Tax=Parasedimentitalea huanghaiensis TaxID=2682100 RepID=UPI001ADA9B84|nr:hypothetical protein [Zongyanglinia huanghaiensis]
MYENRTSAGEVLAAELKVLGLTEPIVLALPRGGVPVAPPETVDELRGLVDTVICPLCPRPFWSVGAHYRDFRQVDDEDVAGMLAEAEGPGTTKD